MMNKFLVHNRIRVEIYSFECFEFWNQKWQRLQHNSRARIEGGGLQELDSLCNEDILHPGS